MECWGFYYGISIIKETKCLTVKDFLIPNILAYNSIQVE